jgi:hypothetical protein
LARAMESRPRFEPIRELNSFRFAFQDPDESLSLLFKNADVCA